MECIHELTAQMAFCYRNEREVEKLYMYGHVRMAKMDINFKFYICYIIYILYQNISKSS